MDILSTIKNDAIVSEVRIPKIWAQIRKTGTILKECTLVKFGEI